MSKLGMDPSWQLPPTLFGFILRISGVDQLFLSLFSVAVFLLNTAPLELQRRLINDALRGGTYWPVLYLALTYGGVALLGGLVKLTMNIYRSFVTARATKSLRHTIFALTNEAAWTDVRRREGFEISMVVAESEPIGGFVGISVSEPVLQVGMLISVFSYMTYLQPMMGLLSFVVFTPQILFVALIQRAINRRVGERVWTLRDVSSEIIGDHSQSDDIMNAQAERVEHVFVLDMGIFKLTFAMKFLLNLFHHLGVACVLGLGGWYVINGQTEIGTIVAFISGLAAVNDPWTDTVSWYRELEITRTRYAVLVAGMKAIGTKDAVDTSQSGLLPISSRDNGKLAR